MGYTVRGGAGVMDRSPGAADTYLRGVIVRPHQEPLRGVIAVRDSVISAVSEQMEISPGAQILDFGDCFILPGFVDVHVHSSSRGEEGLIHATAAAAAGGVTTLIDMPYDVPAPINNPNELLAKGARIASEASVDVALLGTVPPVDGAARVSELLGAGACGIMVSLWEQHAQRYPRIEYSELRKIFRQAADADGVVSMHAETDAIIRPLLEEARRRTDQTDWRLHTDSRPSVSEIHGALTGLEFAYESGTRVHLHQLSHARSFEMVERYRGDGLPATGETLIHHLLFEEGDMATQGGRIKVNPPMRSAANREVLWQKLAAGAISIVASDHSPWPVCEKCRAAILQNQSGMPGLETFPSVLLSEAILRNVPLSRIAEVTAFTPAQTFGLGTAKGDIRPGLDADFIVFDPWKSWQVDRKKLQTSAGWDPYEDREIQGRVIMTMVRGKTVWDGASVLARPGWGQWVRPSLKRVAARE